MLACIYSMGYNLHYGKSYSSVLNFWCLQHLGVYTYAHYNYTCAKLMGFSSKQNMLSMVKSCWENHKYSTHQCKQGLNIYI